MNKRYYDLNSYFRSLFGERVQKISIDAGLDCPNRDGKISTGGCIYCNQKGSGTGAFKEGLSIIDQLERGKKGIARRYKTKKYLAYFQSFTNTYAPVEKLKKLYDEALSVEGVVGLSIGTRPDCINEKILNLLELYAKENLIWLEYGLQTAHDTTLDLINRGHDFNCFIDTVNKTKNRGIKICTHIILGLPGETREMMLESAKRIGDAGIDGVKLHLLYIIENTMLEKLYRNNRYTCLEQNEYVDIVCDFLELLPDNIVIQRLTGDPHPEELVAPTWPLKKMETLTMINNELENRNSFQGRLYKK